jgi:hypothetical protein
MSWLGWPPVIAAILGGYATKTRFLVRFIAQFFDFFKFVVIKPPL